MIFINIFFLPSPWWKWNQLMGDWVKWLNGTKEEEEIKEKWRKRKLKQFNFYHNLTRCKRIDNLFVFSTKLNCSIQIKVEIIYIRFIKKQNWNNISLEAVYEMWRLIVLFINVFFSLHFYLPREMFSSSSFSGFISLCFFYSFLSILLLRRFHNEYKRNWKWYSVSHRNFTKRQANDSYYHLPLRLSRLMTIYFISILHILFTIFFCFQFSISSTFVK